MNSACSGSSILFRIARTRRMPSPCAMCHLDYAMSDADGVTNFVRQYTLASGGPYCDCGYKKKRLQEDRA